MFKITHKQIFKNGFQQIDIKVEDLVKYFFPGQFVFVMASPQSRRVPIASLDVDARRGTLSLFFHSADPFTGSWNDLRVGDELYSVSGPYGKALPAFEKRSVLCIGQGLGVAGVLPLCRYYHGTGNKVIAAFPLKTKSDLVHDSKLRVCSHKVVLTTEDGSYDLRGGIPELLVKLDKENIDYIYADGSLALYDAVIAFAQERQKPVLVNGMSHLREVMVSIETASLSVGSGTCVPVLDGLWFSPDQWQTSVLEKQMEQQKEYAVWRRSRSLSCLSTNEFGIFPKLLSGFLKNKL